MEVSTDWCVAVEHWRSSSIRVIFVNYQTSKLQCKYQSYIQVDNIGDAQGFSGEILTGVRRTLPWKTESKVSLSQKTGYLDCCITATRMCCEKDGCCGRQACIIDVEKSITMEMYFPDRWTWHMITDLWEYQPPCPLPYY